MQSFTISFSSLFCLLYPELSQSGRYVSSMLEGFEVLTKPNIMVRLMMPMVTRIKLNFTHGKLLKKAGGGSS
jgi:hypothetical protein